MLCNIEKGNVAYARNTFTCTTQTDGTYNSIWLSAADVTLERILLFASNRYEDKQNLSKPQNSSLFNKKGCPLSNPL